jgi:hypothetical protein
VKPVLAIAVALGGYLVIRFLGGAVLSGKDAWLIIVLSAWAWVGIVALVVRFGIGAGRPKPEGRWVCKSCLYPNGAHAVVCEACQQPWSPASA